MEVVFPHICKPTTPRPNRLTILKPKYLRALRSPTGRHSSTSNRCAPLFPVSFTRSISPNCKSRQAKTRQHLPRACLLGGDTSKLGKCRIALLWTQKRAEPLSPLSGLHDTFEMTERLELEGLKLRSFEGRPTDALRAMIVRRSRRPLELEIPSVPLRTEMGSEDEQE